MKEKLLMKLTQFRATQAVDVVGQITLLHVDIVVIKDHAIRTKPVGYASILACVVFVTLFGVSKVTIWLWAFVTFFV